MRKIISAILFIIVLILLATSIYLTFFYTRSCENYECFQKAMQDCKKFKYINNEPEASWKYSILGKSNDLCTVNVQLVNAKQGSLEINDLIGEEMICYYPKGYATYPDKELSRCTGKLKEDLQSIIIKKLHTYILENIGELNQSLTNAV